MIGDFKILAVTLARGGSERIPKKNIACIAGKCLIEYTIDEIKKSKFIDKYVVSTDDEEIATVCREADANVEKRPSELSTSTTTSADALKYVLNNNPGFDYLVEIMCTNPLKTVDDIDGCIVKLYDTGADSVVSVVRVWDNHPSRVKYIENDRLMDFYPEIPESRRQDLKPAAYVRNGSIYATTCKSFLLCGNRLGKDTRPYIMPEERTINIDEKRDLMVAKIMMDMNDD